MQRIVNKISKIKQKKTYLPLGPKNMKDLKDESRNKIIKMKQANERKLFTKLPATVSSELLFLKKKISRLLSRNIKEK